MRPPAETGRRAQPAATLRNRARFAWDTSPNPVLARLRCLLDIHLPRRVGWAAFDAGPIRIAYTGFTDGLTHVVPFLWERAAAVGLNPGPVNVCRIEQSLLRRGAFPDADLVAVGCTPRQAASLPGSAAVTAPFRFHLILPLTSDAPAMLAQVSRRERQQFCRERRRRGWRLDRAQSSPDFDYFYTRMHVPTMARRHGSAARTVDRAIAHDVLFAHGMLFFVTENGQRLAGTLCHYDPPRQLLTLRLAGVLDGADEHYRSHIFMAMYLLIIEWAVEQGLDEIDLSGCEPFLSKGIFQFKRKLRPHLRLPINHFAGKRLWIGARRDNAAVRDFLVANPVVTLAPSGQFEAVYFHDTQRPPRGDLGWEGTNIVAARHVNLDEFLAGLPVAGAVSPR